MFAGTRYSKKECRSLFSLLFLTLSTSYAIMEEKIPPVTESARLSSIFLPEFRRLLPAAANLSPIPVPGSDGSSPG